VAPVATTSPTFQWLAEPEATYYLLRIADWNGTYVDRWFTPSAASCQSGTGTCEVTPAASIAPGPATWRILGWSPAGYGPWSETRSFLVDTVNPQAGAPQALSPTGTLWSYHAVYNWSRVADAVLYRLSIAQNGQAATEWWFTPANLSCVTAGTTCAMGVTIPANGATDWRVQAWTASGRSAWSETLTVQFGVFPAPAAPSGLGPAGESGPSPALTWTASANVTYYYLRVDDITGNRVDQWITPGQAGCAGTSTCAFSPAVTLAVGAASWRVLAWNPTGYSPWSATLAFTVLPGASGPSVPGRVTTIAPTGAVATTGLTFTWDARTAATYYLLRVIDWAGSAIERWYTPTQAGCSAGTGTCTSSGVTVPPGPASWKVIAWSAAGSGPWSDTRHITIEVADAATPAPSTIGPSGQLWSHAATYSWASIPEAVLYRLAVATDGGSSYAWFTPTELGCGGSSTTCTRNVTVAANGTVEWQVQAWSVNGYGPWSPALSITFAVFPAPPPPATIAPAASAGPMPTFTWTASANVVYYYLRATDSAGGKVDVWVTPAQAGCTSGTGTCAFTPAVGLGAGAAQWKVLAWNPSGYSPWSATRAFVIAP
jgi:hypothetical protein